MSNTSDDPPFTKIKVSDLYPIFHNFSNINFSIKESSGRRLDPRNILAASHEFASKLMGLFDLVNLIF